ncbi:MAG TPA: enoyl-CoA hydratase-related protein [Candidatus Binatia bacterium]|jgi:methylglutaconyl-CoA hydratase|nr:enoyl-CoA hydratase-related protein [Candidatus Binatia bacterium]
MSEKISIEQEGAVARVILNRPENHNALTPAMIARLRDVFLELGEAASVRVIVLQGEGRSFCAGADLAAMREAAEFTFEENVADGQAIFDLMNAVDRCPRPVVGAIHGVAIGGGAGLVSCCDVALATSGTLFAFSETRLGIMPAVISPFVVAKTGIGPLRELYLTGERFTAERAHQIGLIQHVVADKQVLDVAVQERVKQLLLAAPGAQADVKVMLREIGRLPEQELRPYTSELIARRRASEEGREGMSAFLEKRKPGWQQ